MLVLCVPGDGTRRNKNYKHRKLFISIDSRCFQWGWTECIIFNVDRDFGRRETRSVGNFSFKFGLLTHSLESFLL